MVKLKQLHRYLEHDLSQESPMQVVEYLSQGQLYLEKISGSYAFADLFELAERRNPKRAFLFVSKVLGKHIPVAPHKMRQSYRSLSAQLPQHLPGNTLFLGMAETAVGLAGGIFDEVKARCDDAILLLSTRHQLDQPLLCRFKENHSHASDHLMHKPWMHEAFSLIESVETLVLIDDEATTGSTFKNLLESLVATGHFPHLKQVYALTLTHWCSATIEGGIFPIEAKSLLYGRWQWQADSTAIPPIMPVANQVDAGTQPIIGPQNWGRIGRLKGQADCENAIRHCWQPSVTQLLGNKDAHLSTVQSSRALFSQEPISQEKILVLGTEEFLWPPFLLAENLEQHGYEVYFSSTTRSPIAEGGAIRSAISFADNYGQGISHYLYNIVHQSFDRIFLCIETPRESVDSRLLVALEQVASTVDVLIYAEGDEEDAQGESGSAEKDSG